MSRKLLAFLLRELTTVRVLCRGKNCRGAVELAVEDLARVALPCCPICKADFDPLHTGAAELTELARALLKVGSLKGSFEVEFVLPESGAPSPEPRRGLAFCPLPWHNQRIGTPGVATRPARLGDRGRYLPRRPGGRIPPEVSAMKKFKAGDVVQLASGGPKMTVIEDDPDQAGRVICQWFDGNQAREKSFLEDALAKADEGYP